MKSKTICYDNIFEFCEDVDSSFLRKYYAAMKDNSTVDIAIAAKYGTSRKIINILTDYGFEIANIDFHDAICDGYEDEFVISLCYGLNHSNAMEIWCEPENVKMDILFLTVMKFISLTNVIVRL